jgi:hypothetical protein
MESCEGLIDGSDGSGLSSDNTMCKQYRSAAAAAAAWIGATTTRTPARRDGASYLLPRSLLRCVRNAKKHERKRIPAGDVPNGSFAAIRPTPSEKGIDPNNNQRNSNESGADKFIIHGARVPAAAAAADRKGRRSPFSLPGVAAAD